MKMVNLRNVYVNVIVCRENSEGVSGMKKWVYKQTEYDE